jgi:hypothetical protein
MTRFAKVRVRLVASLAVLVLAILGASAATAAKSKVPVVKPYTAAEWKAIVAKAKQEGSVTIYSSQHPVYLQDFANGFKEKYGITVNVNRNVDTVLVTQITAEQGTGNLKADFWVSASKPQVLGALKNGWVTDARGPSLYASRYDRAQFAKPGKAFAVGAAVLGIAWNSKAVPQGIKDYPGFLNQSLAGGKIGVPDPKAAPAFIDFYLWLQENYGAVSHEARGTEAEDLHLHAADAAGDHVRRDRGRHPRAGDDARPEGAGRARRFRNPAQGSVERSMVGDGPEAGSAPQCRTAPGRLHAHTRGSGARAQELRLRPQGCARDLLRAPPESEAQQLHAGQGEGIQRNVGSPVPLGVECKRGGEGPTGVPRRFPVCDVAAPRPGGGDRQGGDLRVGNHYPRALEALRR